MSDIRHTANDAAQQAFRRMLDHHIRTGRWCPSLIAQWNDAEREFDDLPEHMLDALHEASIAEIVELTDAERDRLPDVPLAWTPIETPQLADYWNRGA